MVGAGVGGEEGRSFQEDLYWTHFHFTHFTQFLRNTDFHHQLALPKTFSVNKKKNLPENVSLKGPGNVVWNVKLTTRDDTFYFTQGWEQYASDNSLKENDFLVFKYNGDSLFEILIFDGESCCEKVAPYFVRARGNLNVERHANGAQHVNVEQHANGEQRANVEQHEQRANGEQRANVEQNANVEQHDGRGNSKKNERENSAENVDNTPSDAGVEIARVEQFVADGGTNTEASDVPCQTTSKKRIKRSATKQVAKPRGRPRKASNSPAEDLAWMTESSQKGIDADDLLL